jgi:predicted dehydrogenase
LGNGEIVEPLRVGVVGCGQIAQIMHLPFLTELQQVRVTAVCDPSAMVVETVGERFGVPARCTDFTDVVNRDDVDAIAVLTMEHTEVAVAAAEAGNRCRRAGWRDSNGRLHEAVRPRV